MGAVHCMSNSIQRPLYYDSTMVMVMGGAATFISIVAEFIRGSASEL